MRYTKTCTTLALVAAVCLAGPMGDAHAQGSIFGLVHNADLSVPSDGSILFFGLINNTDKEVRIQSCVGAGYDGGFWFDDFQNYLNEAVGLTYHYYFFDPATAEGALLQSVIPNNSFEQQDIALSAAGFRPAAAGLQAAVLDNNTVRLDWVAEPSVTWHVYRRDGSSTGSFFRIDNPAGNRTNRGVATAYYVDATVDSLGCYYYMLIGEQPSGTYTPPSDVLFVDVTSCCQGHVGDINGIAGDEPTIGDVALLIDHLFISYTTPQCLQEADINQSGGLHPTAKDISIGDVALLLDHLYITFRPLPLCTDAGN